MKDTASVERMTPRQDQWILEVVERERSRLRNFIRRRVPDSRDAEDVLQDVLYELVEANRLLMPIEHVTGWLFRVARNRITDLFRMKQPESFGDSVEDLLPSPDAGPEALYARNVLLDELALAVDELPAEQRDVFVGHELEGRSFREMAAETGVSVNTLLSRKRYAVLHLRKRLQGIYDELTKPCGAEHEMEMDLPRAAGDPGGGGVCLHRRPVGAALVELAAAFAVWLSPGDLLASAWASGALPDPLRRIRMAWLRSLQNDR